MIREILSCLILGTVACGGSELAEPDDLAISEAIAKGEKLRDTSTVLEPQVPESGELTIAAVGNHNFEGRFSATARICEDLRFLEVTVRTDSVDVIFLFNLPPNDDDVPGDFTVVSATDSLFAVGDVRVGVQIIRGRVGSVFRGTAGAISLTDWGRRIAGTFEVMIREAASESVTKTAGAFRGIRVRATDPAECALTSTGFASDSVPIADPDSLE